MYPFNNIIWKAREKLSRAIFSDETNIMLGNKNKVYVGRKLGWEETGRAFTTLIPWRLRRQWAHPPGVHYVSYQGVRTLSSVDSKLTLINISQSSMKIYGKYCSNTALLKPTVDLPGENAPSHTNISAMTHSCGAFAASISITINFALHSI